MIKNIFKKIGLPLIAVVCAGTIFIKYKLEDNIRDVQANVQIEQENELENTYIDDGYDDINKEDLEDDSADEKYTENTDDSKDESTKIPLVEEEGDDEDKSKPQEENKVEEKPSTAQQTGIFQGFADNNFVEIKIGNSYVTYMVSNEAKKALSNKDIDSNITFVISEVNGQKVITDVK